MLQDKKIFAFIPARGGSKRLPGKNMKELCGKPLVQYTLEAAENSKYIDKFVLSTDEVAIGLMVLPYSKGEVHERKPHQCDDDYSTDDLRCDMYKEYPDYDYYITLHPTAPFRTAEDIDKGIEMIIEADADSLLSVRKITRDYWQALYKVADEIYYVYDELRFKQSQDFNLYAQYYANAHFLAIWKKDKGLVAMTKEDYKEIPFIIDDWKKKIDINHPWEFKIAELVMKEFKDEI